jgi:gas vesicle protein
MENQKGKGQGLAIGVLIGALAGAIAALLLAPKSGKETRENLKQHMGLGGDKEQEKQRARDKWQ